jgi:hypothetical protein
MMGHGLPLRGLSCLSGVLVQFPSLPVSAFSMVAQRSFWLPPAVGFVKLEVALPFLVQHSFSEFRRWLFCLRSTFLSRFHAAQLKAVPYFLVLLRTCEIRQ